MKHLDLKRSLESQLYFLPICSIRKIANFEVIDKVIHCPWMPPGVSTAWESEVRAPRNLCLMFNWKFSIELGLSRFLGRILIGHILIKSSWNSQLHFECTCPVEILPNIRDISKLQKPVNCDNRPERSLTIYIDHGHPSYLSCLPDSRPHVVHISTKNLYYSNVRKWLTHFIELNWMEQTKT